MNDDVIEKNIKHYYSNQAPSSDVLARMKTMADVQSKESENSNVIKLSQQQKQGLWKTGKRFAIAASFTLVALVGAQLTHVLQLPFLQEELIVRVAQEVALNHNKRLASEFVTHNYSQLAATMDKLDFIIKSPEQLKYSGYQLLGARYCSIQGHIAAQIKLVDSKGELMTLYVTRLNDALATLQNQSQQYEKLLIKNWHEGGLFYSLASRQ